MKKQALAKITEREFFKGICEDIAQEVAHHIKLQYPAAVQATPSTFLLSVKGCVFNEIMAALDFKGDALAMSKRIAEKKAFRRHMEAMWRKILIKEDHEHNGA